MIRISSFAEKSDQAWRAFRAKQKLTPLHPGPPGRGIPFCFLVPALKRRPIIGAPLRGAVGSSHPPIYLPRVPCTSRVPVKALYT